MQFFKYHGAGNDFILIDNREKPFFAEEDQKLIVQLCHRNFGIGADGLILLKNHPDYDFEMLYFNADGALGSMCGNGGRCVVAFAKALGIIQNNCSFLASDGLHEAVCENPDWIELKMADVTEIISYPEYLFLDTGSPHVIQFVNDLTHINVDQTGKTIRTDERFAPGGTNVNFIQPLSNGTNIESLKIASFERGVEAETLACGTGVTAAVLAFHKKQGWKAGDYLIEVLAKGGHLNVRFSFSDLGGYENIWLCGPAEKVFEGIIPLAK